MEPHPTRYILPVDMLSSLSLVPIELQCGSFDDPYEYFVNSDCTFVFSSCMSEDVMQTLGDAIGHQCKPGMIDITTEIAL